LKQLKKSFNFIENKKLDTSYVITIDLIHSKVDPPSELGATEPNQPPSFDNMKTPQKLNIQQSVQSPKENYAFVETPKNDPSYQDDDLLVVESRYCTACNLEQPLRSKHCQDCNRCVAQYDHHCPWLGNCVGEKNHQIFYWYLIFEMIETGWALLFVKNSSTV
jgi:hypothetical protein